MAASLGFTPAEVTSLTQDNADFQSIAATTVALDTFAAAVREYRINLTEGKIGDPQPVFPAGSFTAPPNNGPAGLFERLDDLVKRIRVAPAYTPETGAALGIIPSTPTGPLPGDLKPVIKASESFSGYKFNLDVARPGMSAFKVQINATTQPYGPIPPLQQPIL